MRNPSAPEGRERYDRPSPIFRFSRPSGTENGSRIGPGGSVSLHHRLGSLPPPAGFHAVPFIPFERLSTPCCLNSRRHGFPSLSLSPSFLPNRFAPSIKQGNLCPMASTHLSLHYHIVFSTKHREPSLDAAQRPRIHEYLGGTIRGLKGIPHAVGGTADHVHLLLSLRASHCLADVMREVKSSCAPAGALNLLSSGSGGSARSSLHHRLISVVPPGRCSTGAVKADFWERGVPL